MTHEEKGYYVHLDQSIRRVNKAEDEHEHKAMRRKTAKRKGMRGELELKEGKRTSGRETRERDFEEKGKEGEGRRKSRI